MRQDRENQFWTERLERAVLKWTRSLNSHTGPRHMKGRSSRPDTCQHPTTRRAVRKFFLHRGERFFLHRGGRPHMSSVFRTFDGAERELSGISCARPFFVIGRRTFRRRRRRIGSWPRTIRAAAVSILQPRCSKPSIAASSPHRHSGSALLRERPDEAWRSAPRSRSSCR